MCNIYKKSQRNFNITSLFSLYLFSWDIFKVLQWDLCTVKVWSLLKTQSLVCSLTCGGAVDAQHYVVLPHFRMKTRIKILPSRTDSNYSTHILKRWRLLSTYLQQPFLPSGQVCLSFVFDCVMLCMYLSVRGSVTVWQISGTKTRVLTFNLLSTHTLDWSFWHYIRSPRI